MTQGFMKNGKFRPTNKLGINAYSRKEIAERKAEYGVQGTTKYLGVRCQHCGGNDATFKHKRGNGTMSDVRCIRCKRHATM